VVALDGFEQLHAQRLYAKDTDAARHGRPLGGKIVRNECLAHGHDVKHRPGSARPDDLAVACKGRGAI